MWEFSESTVYEFAGTTTTFSANTIKLAINVKNWPFYSLSNQLEIVFESNEKQNSGGDACFQNESDEQGNLRWLMVIINSTSLYHLF